MKALLFIVLTFISLSGNSQTTISNYKYVVVPSRYSFLKIDDQYGLNTSTKELLQQKGFVVFMSNEKLPDDLVANPCKALHVEMTNRNTMFTTNLTLELRDCQNNVLFRGNEGKSREKEYIDAYNEALKGTFASLTATPPAASPNTPTPSPAAPPPTAAPPTVSTSVTPAPTDGSLYAQPIENGFQLVDTTPKRVLTLLKTSLPDQFIGQTGASTGIVFKKDGIWIFEYYEDNKLVSRKLEIKF
jgi:hypothetical protein